MERGTKGTGSKPLMMRMQVPTRVLKACLNLVLPTLGLPKVMQRTSASGYLMAAHAAPVYYIPTQIYVPSIRCQGDCGML